MNTTTFQSPLLTDLKQEETSTVQGGYYGCYRPRLRCCYVVYPSYRPVYSGNYGSGVAVSQNVNINVVND